MLLGRSEHAWEATHLLFDQAMQLEGRPSRDTGQTVKAVVKVLTGCDLMVLIHLIGCLSLQTAIKKGACWGEINLAEARDTNTAHTLRVG